MQYVRYTLVDVVTQVPCTQEPTKNGPAHPAGITPTFGVEESYGSHPEFYGIAEDADSVKDWMTVLSDEEFYRVFKAELKARARKKRKIVEQGGVKFGEITLRTDIDSQNRVASLVTSLNNMPELTVVDFEANPGQWVQLSREEGLAIGRAVSTHVQSTFSWCKQLHDKVDAIQTLDDALPVVIEIDQYKVEQ